MYYNIFFKNLFHKFILVSRMRKLLFLSLSYENEHLIFKNKKFEKKRYYYNLDKYESRKRVLKNKFS